MNVFLPPPGTQRPVSRLNALRRAASSGCPGAAGLGTREANRQYTAFETSFGRRDVAARPASARESSTQPRGAGGASPTPIAAHDADPVPPRRRLRVRARKDHASLATNRPEMCRGEGGVQIRQAFDYTCFANYDFNTSSVEQARPPTPTHASPGPSRRSTRPRSRGRRPQGLAARTESYRRRAPAAASSQLVWSACLAPREAPARFVLPRRRRIPRSAVAAAARGRRATRPPAAAAVLLVSSRHRPRRTPALASSRRTSGSAGPCAAEAAWTAATPFSRPRRGPLARKTG